MSRHLPIACTLDAPAYADREASIARLGRDALLDGRLVDGGRAELRFAAGAGIRERVDAFVAAESTCCAFFAMDVTQTGDEILLTIAAPADAEPVLAELVAAFRPDRELAR